MQKIMLKSVLRLTALTSCSGTLNAEGARLDGQGGMEQYVAYLHPCWL